jgi:hypothetical protein
VLRGQHEEAVFDVEVHVGEREISFFDDCAERHLVAIAGADMNAPSVFDEKLP